MLNAGEWICSTNAKSLANIVKLSSRATNGTRDPLNLIYIANSFKEDIVFDGLLSVLILELDLERFISVGSAANNVNFLVS